MCVCVCVCGVCVWVCVWCVCVYIFFSNNARILNHTKLRIFMFKILFYTFQNCLKIQGDSK